MKSLTIKSLVLAFLLVFLTSISFGQTKIYNEKADAKKEVAEAVAKAKKEGKGYYDLFRGRVIFPVFSFSGEVLGFGGRVLGDEKPKYLNSPQESWGRAQFQWKHH